MSNRRKSLAERVTKKLKVRACPQCGFKRHLAKEYDDAWLYTCARCEFPERVVK